MSAALDAAREASPDMEWEEERDGKRRLVVGVRDAKRRLVVGVRDAFTAHEVVIRLEWVRVAGGEGRWCAWLRSAKGRGGCNFCAYGDTIKGALDQARRLFKKEMAR